MVSVSILEKAKCILGMLRSACCLLSSIFFVLSHKFSLAIEVVVPVVSSYPCPCLFCSLSRQLCLCPHPLYSKAVFAFISSIFVFIFTTSGVIHLFFSLSSDSILLFSNSKIFPAPNPSSSISSLLISNPNSLFSSCSASLSSSLFTCYVKSSPVNPSLFPSLNSPSSLNSQSHRNVTVLTTTPVHQKKSEIA